MEASCELPDGVQARAIVSEVVDIRVGSVAVSMPFPSHGLAHLELSASKSGRYLVVRHCSGQSEESYRVLDRRASLRTVASASNISGETNSVAFSNDERRFIAAIPSSCKQWWECLEDVDGTDEAGRAYFEFGTLLTHDLQARSRTKTSMRIWLEDDWSMHWEPYDPFLLPSFTSSASVTLQLPWGPEALRFPFGDVVWLRPP